MSEGSMSGTGLSLRACLGEISARLSEQTDL